MKGVVVYRSLSTTLRHLPFAFSVEPPDSQVVAA